MIEVLLAVLIGIKMLSIPNSRKTYNFNNLLCITFSLITDIATHCPSELRYGPGGDTPYNGLYGVSPPKRGTFLRLEVKK